MRLSRRRLLTLGLAAPLLGSCTTDRVLEAISAPKPSGALPTRTGRTVLLWHADAVPGERVFARELKPLFEARHADLTLEPLGHGDPDGLLRRATQAAAGGIGPDVLQVPGEWLPEAVARRLLRPLAETPGGDGWSSPALVELGKWNGASYGVPAAPYYRQPFYNDELLRNAGLVQAGRTTPPSTWAEYADVSKRVAAPEDRWGSVFPSHQADETLYLHFLQHLVLAGGDPPRPEGGRVRLETPAARQALEFLLDLVQTRGALPLDRPPFRVAETSRAGLWWTDARWIADEAAIGSPLRARATPVPRGQAGRGVLLRSRHWCAGAHGGARDETGALLGFLSEDAVSQLYCAAVSLAPARRVNWDKPPYRPTGTPTPQDGAWPGVIEQLAQAENRPLITFPAYRPVAGRIAGELQLVLTGKKPIATALAEGEAGLVDVLKQAEDALR